ncbi:cytochrome c oxidase subunit II [Luteimonas sp. BDR2-5]|uniref:cytochrome c oxidase subunit II n=1 Tax=Proluteimonas luteida TaxID=2878685 RepID=UPI001E41AC97|nr:cytochrome c oxidase subunit II [Luteimonas sp. BDR2-5]MCD9028840.1 cytochrome c oxidase subunit II [Luteimonas sp. BDR2-5]
MHRHRRRATALAFSAVAPALLGACGGPQSALSPAGPAAATIAQGWWLMATAFTAVWAIVLALLWLALRRRDGDSALRHPRRLIVAGGFVLPTVVLAALLVWGSLTSGRLAWPGEEPDAVIDVTARQWQWHFHYRDADGAVVAESLDEVVLPLGRMVELRITSDDVIHGFWIPRLAGKIDAIPGRVNVLRLQADEATPMRGQCAEFCGLDHARMEFRVRVVDDAAWAAWLAGDASAADAPADAAGAPAATGGSGTR